MKKNCWEFTKCGRAPGGLKVHKFGVCPAATDVSSDGINNGHNGGRLCWAIGGTFCGGKIQGEFAKKHMSCLNCDFYILVSTEEGPDCQLLKPGQKYHSPIRK
jgi:hypothetical protein